MEEPDGYHLMENHEYDPDNNPARDFDEVTEMLTMHEEMKYYRLKLIAAIIVIICIMITTVVFLVRVDIIINSNVEELKACQEHSAFLQSGIDSAKGGGE